MSENTLSLTVQRSIRAPVEKVFAAWTNPTHLRQWWGPANVECPEAEIDLRVGGKYRIANRLDSGAMIWIAGEFIVIDPPHELVFSWRIEPAEEAIERVTVRLKPSGVSTNVVVTHERIGNAAQRQSHLDGWNGCLDGLADYFGGP